jgi:hypothetical protein
MRVNVYIGIKKQVTVNSIMTIPALPYILVSFFLDPAGYPSTKYEV